MRPAMAIHASPRAACRPTSSMEYLALGTSVPICGAREHACACARANPFERAAPRARPRAEITPN